jgi:hypothetical protein
MEINTTLRTLAKVRRFVFNHENLIINTLASMTVLLFICVSTLIIGFITTIISY